MTSERIETDNDTDTAWWAAPRFIISAVLVALLVVVGLILALWPDGEDPSQAQPAPAATGAAANESGESVCGLEATGGTTLTKAPEVEWEALGGIYIPSSEKHGPGTVDPDTGVRSCFSHTPEGALLAATSMLTSSARPEVLLETTRELGIDSPGKDVAIGQIQQRIARGDSSSVPVQVAGFRLLSYTGDKATVEVVLAGDDGSEKVYNTTSGDLVWHEGDWHFQFQDDGSGGPVSGMISDLSGYVEWGKDDG